jgi:hypothetical protein
MMCLQILSEDDDTQLKNHPQIDVWVTYLNAINTHEAMNLAPGREAAKRQMAVTGMEEDGGSSVLPTDSSWVRVFAPSLSTFVRDVAGLKMLGRPNRQQVARVDSDGMTVEDPMDFANVKAIEPEPTTDLAALRPGFEPVWNGHMARNWNRVRSQLQALGKGVKDCREENRKGLKYVDQELSSSVAGYLDQNKSHCFWNIVSLGGDRGRCLRWEGFGN